MPYMVNGHRDYKTEYNKYHKRNAQKHNRALRNAARREYEESHGNLPHTMDVDHRRPLSKGGTNSNSNLRAQSRSRNRSYRRTSAGAIK